MKRVFFAAAALFAFGTLSAQTAEDVTAKFNEAAGLMNSKNFAGALAAFNEVVTLGADVEGVETTVSQAQTYIPTCYFRVGLDHAQANRLDEALESFNSAVETGELYSNPKVMKNAKTMIARVYTMKGGAAFNNGDYAAAAEVFAKGYEANPNDTKLAINLAKSYCEMGRLDDGVKVYQGILAQTSPRFEEDKAVARKDMDYYFLKTIAEMTNENAEDEAVIAVAEKWVAVDNTDPQANKVLLQQYGAAKNFDKVIELAEGVAALQTSEEDKSEVYYTLGVAYNAKEQKPQAIAALKKVTAGPAAELAKKTVAELSK